ncbi:MAG: type II secretion system F family protein [Acidimicrobiia bacterium]
MRGLAVLVAAVAAWVLAGGSLPHLPLVPRPHLPARAWWGALGIGLVVGMLALGLTAVPSVAWSSGVLAAAAPLTAARLRVVRRRRELREQWPDFLAILRGELAGGGSLPEAFVAAGLKSGGRLAEAAQFVAESGARGIAFASALAELRLRFADPVADRVLLTVGVANRTGGHRVATVLSTVSASVSDELRLRKAHDAALTQQRLTAAVALVAPWVLLVLTVITNPTAAQAYRTGNGSLIVLVGLGATLAGYALALRTARLSEPPRVFR